MSAPASGTPLETLIEHLAAFSSGDDRRFSEILSLPFVHLWQDGEIWRYDDGGEVDLSKQYAKAGIDSATFGRTGLDDASLILDWKDLKAFHVRFTRYTSEGNNAGRAEAIWVVIRDEGCWKLKLRIGAARIK
jgi:hypothetical protein